MTESYTYDGYTPPENPGEYGYVSASIEIDGVIHYERLVLFCTKNGDADRQECEAAILRLIDILNQTKLFHPRRLPTFATAGE